METSNSSPRSGLRSHPLQSIKSSLGGLCGFLRPKPPKSHDLAALSTILPALIRWRWLAFYAPFYTCPQYESKVLERSAQVEASKVKSYAWLSGLADLYTSKYAAHRARIQANAILETLSQDTANIDLLALYNKYLKEDRLYRRFRKITGWNTTLFFPTLRTVINVAGSLDIPLRQCELAMEMFAQYVDLMHSNTLKVDGLARSAYEVLEIRSVVTENRWKDIAHIVYDDIREVSSFHILPVAERGGKDKWLDITIFSQAAHRCRARYFKVLSSARSTCILGSADDHGLEPCGRRLGKFGRNIGPITKGRNGREQGVITTRSGGENSEVPQPESTLRKVAVVINRQLCTCTKTLYSLKRLEVVTRGQGLELLAERLPNGKSNSSTRSSRSLHSGAANEMRSIEEVQTDNELVSNE